MQSSQVYVLVLDEQNRHLQRSVLSRLSEDYRFVTATSVEHAINQVRQMDSCLVILVGESQNWFEHQVRALRQADQTPNMTIVALTESGSPRWQNSDRALDLDGFLVQPLTDDILVSLVQSAAIKKAYQQAS